MSANYVLSVVRGDGELTLVKEYGEDLVTALCAQHERQQLWGRPSGERWFVHDADDPERGWFTWDRLTERVADLQAIAEAARAVIANFDELHPSLDATDVEMECLHALSRQLKKCRDVR